MLSLPFRLAKEAFRGAATGLASASRGSVGRPRPRCPASRGVTPRKQIDPAHTVPPNLSDRYPAQANAFVPSPFGLLPLSFILLACRPAMPACLPPSLAFDDT